MTYYVLGPRNEDKSLSDSDFLSVDFMCKSVGGSMSFDLFDLQSHNISLTLKSIQPPGKHHNYHLEGQPTAGNLVLNGCPRSEENAKEMNKNYFLLELRTFNTPLTLFTYIVQYLCLHVFTVYIIYVFIFN